MLGLCPTSSPSISPLPPFCRPDLISPSPGPARVLMSAVPDVPRGARPSGAGFLAWSWCPLGRASWGTSLPLFSLQRGDSCADAWMEVLSLGSAAAGIRDSMSAPPLEPLLGGDPQSSVHSRQPGLQSPGHAANAVCDLAHFAFFAALVSPPAGLKWDSLLSLPGFYRDRAWQALGLWARLFVTGS